MKITIVVDNDLVDGEAIMRRSTFDEIQKNCDALFKIPDDTHFAVMGTDPFKPQFIMQLSHKMGLKENTLYVSQDVKNRVYKNQTEIKI